MKKKNLKSDCKKEYDTIIGEYSVAAINNSSFIQEFLEKHESILTVEEAEIMKANALLFIQFSIIFSLALDIEPFFKITEVENEGSTNYSVHVSKRMTLSSPCN